MLKRLFKNPLFLIGFLFVFALLTVSLIHTYAFDGHIRQVQMLYDENNNLIAAAPLEPSWQLPLGTDRLGFDLLTKISVGAKYTIIFAFIIAFLRVFVSFLIGIFYGNYLMRYKRYIDGFVDSFHFIPLTLLAYYILRPVLWETPDGFLYTFTERVSIEVIVLTLLAIPVLSVLIGSETNEILKEEFIDGARVLGGSRWHLMKRHVMPHLFPRLVIIFGQQVIQVLLVFAHLGLLQLFFGGTDIDYSRVPDPPQSFSGEWSGLIGNSFREIRVAPWIVLAPITFFALTMLAMNFMLEGYKRVLNDRSMYAKKVQKEKTGQKAEAESGDSWAFTPAEADSYTNQS